MKILKVVYEFFEAVGKARAATILTRAGKLEEAKALYVD